MGLPDATVCQPRAVKAPRGNARQSKGEPRREAGRRPERAAAAPARLSCQRGLLEAHAAHPRTATCRRPHLVHEHGEARQDLQREPPQAMRQRRQEQCVCPAALQAAPGHVRGQEAEGASSCGETCVGGLSGRGPWAQERRAPWSAVGEAARGPGGRDLGRRTASWQPDQTPGQHT